TGFPPQHGRRRLFHPDDVRGIQYLNVEHREVRVRLELALDVGSNADEGDWNLRPGSQDRPLNDGSGGPIAPHRIDGNAHEPKTILSVLTAADGRSVWSDVPEFLFFHRADLPAPVVSTIRTNLMRQFALVTLRAFAHADRRERIMRPAFRGPGL